MSSFGVVERKNYSSQVPPATRLIPGKQSAGLPARKKSQSVTLDSRRWAESTDPEEGGRAKENVISLLANSVFPRPAGDLDRPHVVLWVCADLVLLTITLAMLSILAQGRLAPSTLGTFLV